MVNIILSNLSSIFLVSAFSITVQEEIKYQRNRYEHKGRETYKLNSLIGLPHTEFSFFVINIAEVMWY